MPVLLNPRHEAFAQAIAKGKSHIEAHETAGFRPNKGNAYVLTRTQHIASRIQELIDQRNKIEKRALQKAVKITGISKARVLEEMGRMGFANMADYLTITPTGPVLDWASITRETAAAIQEVTIDEFDDGTARQVKRVRFKLASKQAALEKIGIELGMFVTRTDNKHSSGEKRLSQMPPEERRTYVADLLARAREAIERQRAIEGQAHEIEENPK